MIYFRLWGPHNVEKQGVIYKKWCRFDANLDAEKNDGSHADPAVQCVHICCGRLCQVMTVKDGFQTHRGDDQSGSLQYCMGNL